MVADARAVATVESGTAKELSAGYKCELVWEDGVAPSGERYQAKQVAIRGDQIAIVPKGRAGADCRIGDSAEPANSRTAASFADMAAVRDAARAAQGYPPPGAAQAVPSSRGRVPRAR